MVSHIQSNVDDIKTFTVGISRSADADLALGTGVIVTDDGLVVTCYHVISDLYKKIISNIFYISFPAEPGIKLPAQVVNEFCSWPMDIAFLKLQGALPKQIVVAKLSEAIEPAHMFESFGFRKQKTFEGLYADGIIQGRIRKKFSEDNKISLHEVIQLKSDGIDNGMSGSAVLDKDINRVIGIVSEHYRSQGDADNDLSFAIPVESIIQVYSKLREENLGLSSDKANK
jgi:S1-C subfamily serine protease